MGFAHGWARGDIDLFILLLGLSLYVLFGLLVVACLTRSGFNGPSRTRDKLILSAVALGLGLFLLRPDEEIEAGEDPGIYIHAAMAYARNDAFSFDDPALARLEPSACALFRYGHKHFLLTKNHALWAKGDSPARVGASFYPGYSLLLAVPVALGFPYAALWVSPLLAVMTGLLVAGLARRLTNNPRIIGPAFALYLLNPIVAWNARCLRAEWPAAFMIMAALTLWSAFRWEPRRARAGTGLLAGFALGGATLFHPTALYAVVPAVFLALFQTERKPFWAGWWLGLLAGLSALGVQLIAVTDRYGVLANFVLSEDRGLYGGALAVMAVAAYGLRKGSMRLMRGRKAEGERLARVLGCCAVLLALGVVAYAWRYRGDDGRIPGLPPWTVNYASLTDFEGLARMISRTWMILSLFGLLLLGAGGGEPGRLGRRVLLVLGPAALINGWVINYMFETRRMLTFLAPLITLSSVAALAFLAEAAGRAADRFRPARETRGRRLRQGALWAMTALLLLSAAHGRSRLYTTWNRRGTFDFYRRLSERARTEGDFILAEYTQVATPVESLSGLPTLPLAWGYRSSEEYREAEAVWQRLVRERPEERFLLLSPFAGSVIPGTVMEPLFSTSLETIVMGRARRRIPDGPHPSRRTLYVSRIRAPGEEAKQPIVMRQMDGSRLGLSGEATLMIGRDMELSGVPVPGFDEEGLLLRIPDGAPPGRLYLFLATAAHREPSPLRCSWGETTGLVTNSVTVGDRWTIAILDRPERAITEPRLHAYAGGDVFLTDAFYVPEKGGEPTRLSPDATRRPWILADTDSQWMRASSSVALPSGESDRLIALLATHGREDRAAVELSVKPAGGQGSGPMTRLLPGWHWYLLPLVRQAPAAEGVTAFDMDVVPPWNPGLSGFPDDLGLRLAVMGTLR